MGDVTLLSCLTPPPAVTPQLVLCPSLHWPGPLLPPTHPSSFPAQSPLEVLLLPGHLQEAEAAGSVTPILRDLPPPGSPPELRGHWCRYQGPVMGMGSWRWQALGAQALSWIWGLACPDLTPWLPQNTQRRSSRTPVLCTGELGQAASEGRDVSGLTE